MVVFTFPIFLFIALVGEMSAKHRQPFRTNYSVKNGFHAVLMIAHQAVTTDFPDELEVVIWE